MREFRSIAAEFRQSADDERMFSATVCRYNVTDQHRTKWSPGVFTDSLRSKLPKAVWSHDWNPAHRPSWSSYEDSPEKLDVNVKLADFDAVKDARMAHSLLKDEMIDQFSFGFVRQADRPDPTEKGVTLITKAQMDEVSPVLVGSVPGTRTISVRTAESGLLIPTNELRDAVMSRTPHPYKKTSGDGSVCATCGGAPDIKAHDKARRSAYEIRTLTDALAGEPVDGEPNTLIAAADTALDTAIALAADQDDAVAAAVGGPGGLASGCG